MYVSFFLVFYGLRRCCCWGGKKFIPRWGRNEWAKKYLPPLFSLSFQQYLLSHICFPCLLRIVTELCIGARSSRGEKWYNIKPPPRIIKQRAWALNEGCCVEEYMFPFSLSRMGIAVFLLRRKFIDSKMGAGWICEEIFAPPLLSWSFTSSPSVSSVYLISYGL